MFINFSKAIQHFFQSQNEHYKQLHQLKCHHLKIVNFILLNKASNIQLIIHFQRLSSLLNRIKPRKYNVIKLTLAFVLIVNFQT